MHLFREVAKFSKLRTVGFLCFSSAVGRIAAYYSHSMASSECVRPPPKVATTYESLPFLEVKVKGDGNCLFRALSDQLYFDEGRHYLKVREEICDYLGEHKNELQEFFDTNVVFKNHTPANYESYVAKMREEGEWGGELEMKAAADVYSYVPLLTNFVDV